ncbi:MAG: hypothetical protein AAGI34_06165 [Pseudomonadota bacterium]
MRASIAIPLGLAMSLGAGTASAIDGDRIQVTGEVIDTWCYFSGVMGGPDAVSGSAHHTCAMWCAAGGIPVGIEATDGKVYMVLAWQGNSEIADGSTMLTVQAHNVVADGIHYSRDGIDYLLVENVVEDLGLLKENHVDYGVIPGFTIPDPNK